MSARLFYGWIVVAATFSITFVGFGCAYTFSAFVPSLQQEFAASRGNVSLVFSLAGFLYFAFGVVSGPLAERWGVRRLAMFGMLLVGAGLAAASVARTLTQVYLAYALATWLIAGTGWRSAYLILGIGAAVLGAGMAALIAGDPAEKGTGPDGLPPQAVRGAGTAADVSLRDAIRSPAFAALYGACLLASLGVFVPFVHLVPYAVDHHLDPSHAVLLLGAIGVGSTIGRFFLGGLADRLGRQFFLLLMFAGMAAALALWSVAMRFWPLLAFAMVFGVFYGGWVAILPAVVMDLFGGRSVGSIIGVLYTSVAVGTLIGPSAAGYAYDLSHSYTIPILASVGVNLLAAGIMALVRKT